VAKHAYIPTQTFISLNSPKSGSQIRVPYHPPNRSKIGVSNQGPKLGSQLGSILGVHIEGPKSGSILGVRIGGPYWGSILGVHIGGPYWGSILGVYIGGVYWGSILGVHMWGP
jgi:hypothetical protein